MPGSSDPTLLVLLSALLCCAVAIAIAVWQLVARAREAEKQLARLEELAALRAEVERLARQGPELDLRRIEHVLLDLRDLTRRTEERMLALLESSRARGPESTLPVAAAQSPAELSERVLARLVTLGYERARLVTPLAELAPLLAGEGSLRVEARRDGVACKGHVRVRAGTLLDVEMQAAYSTFP